MNRKLWTAIGACAVALLVVAATYTNSWTDGIFTGNGGVTTDIGSPMWGVNGNATVQISRNQTGDGGGQRSALDLYSGQTFEPNFGGYILRGFVDGAVDGGRVASWVFDNGGFFRLRGSIIASGVVKNVNGTGPEGVPLDMYSDGYAILAGDDMPYGTAIAAMANGYAVEGDPNSQVFIAMDGHVVDAGIGEYHPNVRLAIDGNSGAIRWSNSIANSYRTATWDAKFGRVAANILGDTTTSLQTPHLLQPTSDHDVAGTLAIVAANNKTWTFATAYTSAPICVLSPTANMGGILWWVTTTTTTVKVNLSAVSTTTFNYVCVGNPS